MSISKVTRRTILVRSPPCSLGNEVTALADADLPVPHKDCWDEPTMQGSRVPDGGGGGKAV
jgi:hypothetical protein